MISRREVVTGGVLGSWSANALAEADQGRAANRDSEGVANELSNIKDELSKIKGVLDDGLLKSSLGHDAAIGLVRNAYRVFLRANGKFPEFCEIGSDVFYIIYDWHVKHQQPINIMRLGDNRMAIQFMFTQLILRWEQDGSFVGIPFDR
ncbi:MAG: hypothetical protein ABI665_28860 [Vicinamibacterales bacterium]